MFLTMVRNNIDIDQVNSRFHFYQQPSSIMMTPMIFATGELALKLSLMQPETLGCLRIVAVLILLEVNYL
jgi:hypothetical protein